MNLGLSGGRRGLMRLVVELPLNGMSRGKPPAKPVFAAPGYIGMVEVFQCALPVTAVDMPPLAGATNIPHPVVNRMLRISAVLGDRSLGSLGPYRFWPVVENK